MVRRAERWDEKKVLEDTMSGNASSQLPSWAPRVSQGKIRRLYELDSLGISDEVLMDEVGYALVWRCQTFLEANEATQGEATCPTCHQKVMHHFGSKEIIICQNCGWQITWKEYFSTIQHKQLSGAEPVIVFFREYIERFPKAQTPHEKMFLIDRVLHGFHYYGTKVTTRPVAINLIEGKLNEVIDFLDSLTYSNLSTPGIQENLIEWQEKSQNARSWRK